MRVFSWINSVIPYKAISAVFSTALILLVIQLGYGSVEVGYTSAFISLGAMISSLYWGVKIFAIKNKQVMLLIGYAGFIISMLLAYIAKSISAIYLAAFVFSFFSNAILFSYIALITRRSKSKNVVKRLAKFETLGGWGWVLGLVAGMLMRNFLSLQEMIYLILLASVATLAFSLYTVKKGFVKKVLKRVEKEGVLYLVEEGVKFIEGSEELIFKKMLHAGHSVASYIPNFRILIPTIKLKRPMIHLSYFILFFALGIFSPQLITLIKAKGYGDSVVFLVSFVSSLFSAIFYSKTRKVKRIKESLGRMLMFRAVALLSLALIALLPGVLFIASVILFQVVDGITWAYILVLSNTLLMRRAKKLLGINNFYRVLGFILGNLAGGYLIASTNFFLTFLASGLIFSAAFVMIKNVKF